jgi:hypothetical protein
MRVVRHHHNCFVEVFIQPLENLQNFRRRMTVEIACGFAANTWFMAKAGLITILSARPPSGPRRNIANTRI